MIFWDNLLRYPRFFLSSMIGLILIVINPIVVILKKFDDKKIIYIFFISVLITLFCILKAMLNFE
uniref:Uncharacterized protein ycf33 n=2 Tax=Scytosiphon TaxID=27966 RepID=A0A7T8JJX7_SCYLO|nr:hypothetical protein SlomFM_129 [Scytosiphon promiscuus]YP_010147372.1 hypothetical protein K4Z63_pgp132 [Scytosiphon lomentaria]QDM58415.1 hypothetical protein SlomFM_129 [Scytosiphon promiscuus]QDM58558.1 hypothetical protein SlomM_129 [Scytosiphon promiscuus]QQP22180.1 hypothetical protein [Scytosiphon lomentaria]QTW91555.1 hypothetical chloroplast protein 33 [Scytosiphon lomentaria]WAM64653.1 hypothetical protein [Scytosiphon lomentaria]